MGWVLSESPLSLGQKTTSYLLDAEKDLTQAVSQVLIIVVLLVSVTLLRIRIMASWQAVQESQGSRLKAKGFRTDGLSTVPKGVSWALLSGSRSLRSTRRPDLSGLGQLLRGCSAREALVKAADSVVGSPGSLHTAPPYPACFLQEEHERSPHQTMALSVLLGCQLAWLRLAGALQGAAEILAVPALTFPHRLSMLGVSVGRQHRAHSNPSSIPTHSHQMPLGGQIQIRTRKPEVR